MKKLKMLVVLGVMVGASAAMVFGCPCGCDKPGSSDDYVYGDYYGR